VRRKGPGISRCEWSGTTAAPASAACARRWECTRAAAGLSHRNHYQQAIVNSDVPARSALPITDQQSAELTVIAQSRSLPAGYVFRAKLILMLAQGASFHTIKTRLGTTAPTIIRWKQRFLAAGIDGLDTCHSGPKPTVLTPALRARILAATRKTPADHSRKWSCRKLAASLGVSKDTVHRAWKQAGLKPQRLKR
jgi:transposase